MLEQLQEFRTSSLSLQLGYQISFLHHFKKEDKFVLVKTRQIPGGVVLEGVLGGG